MKKLPLLASFFTLIMSQPALAWQDVRQGCSDAYLEKAAEKDILILDCNIVVTGNLPAAWSEETEAIESISVDLPVGARVENALQQVAGLQQFRRSDAASANPTGQGVTLRGLGGNASSRLLLLLDDVPQADPFGGWIAWPGYDALRLAGIYVRKGGGIASAGPGALGGVIELDSRQNVEAVEAAIAYGSRDSVDAKANLERNLGGGNIALSGSYVRGDGFIPILRSQRGAVDRRAGYEQYGVALRAVAPVGDDTDLQANIRGFDDRRERGFAFSDNRNSGVDASLRLVSRPESGWQWNALGYVQIRDFENRFGSVAGDRNSVSLVLDQYSVPSTGLGAHVEVRPPLGDDVELRLGGDWRRTIGETKENFFFTGLVPGRNRIAGGRTDIWGGFAEGSWRATPDLTLTLGGRLDRWIIANGFRREINIGGTVRSDDRFAGRSGWEGTGRFGLAFTATDNLTLRGAAYSSWRLPTLNELYRPFRVGPDATAANELLSPERLKGGEASLDWDDGSRSFGVTAFFNQLDRAIANVTLGQGPGNFPGVGFVGANGTYRQRQNLGGVESRGVELRGEVRAGDFRLHGRYTYVNAEVEASGNSAPLNGLRPAQVPRHFASGGVVYDGYGLTMAIDARYVGGQYEDDGNSRRLADAFTVDAGLSYRIDDNFRLQLRGENIFDEEVQAAISSDNIVERATPRTLWLGIALAI